MKRQSNRLNALQVAKLKTQGRYPDGGNLYLQVSESGSKSWLFRYAIDGKERQLGLGSESDFTLAEARERATAQRKLLADGIDPLATKRDQKLARSMAAANIITFDKAATAYIAAHSAGWRNAKHGDQWKNTLDTYASPVIGKLPVSSVNTALVLRILEPMWADKTETASRLRGRIERVLDWAKVQGYRTGENPALWRGHLENLLAKKSKVAKVAHHPALPWQEMGAFMGALSAMQGSAALALQLIILCASRTSEVLNAQWAEFDLDGALWIIPADRMKAEKEHRVPLSDAALAVLVKAKAEALDSEFVFPGRKGSTLTNMACLAVLKRMGRADLTVHGFRSTFRDWCSESTDYPRDVAELALAHTIGDKVEAAYRRGDLMEKRRALMGDWSAYCGTVRAPADVVQIRSKVAA